jgi:hypothetical protein
VSKLDSARVKIGWAKKHLDCFDREADRFLARKPYTVTREPQFAVGHNRYRLHVRERPPGDLALIAGDCVHNAKSALDHVAWQLAGADPDDTGTQFPIFANETKFATAKRQYQLIPSRPLAVVTYLQPYRRSQPLDDLLWAIYALDNADKHKTLALGLGMAEPKPSITAPPWSHTDFHVEFVLGPFEDDAVIGEITAFAVPRSGGPPNANVKVDVEFTFRVALVDPITDLTVLFATRDLRNAVARAEAVVEMFARYI